MLAALVAAVLAPTLPVPSDSLAVAVVRDPGRLGALIGRDLSGVPGPVWVALLSADGLTGPAPAVVAVLPGTSAEKVRAGLLTDSEREQWHVVAVPGGVAVTPHEPSARRMQAGFERLSLRQLGPAADTFAGSSAALAVNLRQVRAAHGDAVRAAGQVAGLALRAGGVPWLRGFDARQRDTAAGLVAAAFRVALDGDALVLGLDEKPDGVRASLAWAVTPGSASARMVAGEAPTPLAELSDLPAGLPLTASRFGPKSVAAWRAVAPEFAAVPGDAAGRKAVAELDRLTTLAGVAVSGGGVTLTQHPDPAAVTAAHAAVLGRLDAGAAVRNLPVRGRPKLTAAGSRGGFALTRAAVELDLDAAAAGVADDNLRLATAESVKRLAGSDPAYTFGHDGGRFVRVEAGASLAGFLAPRTRAGADPVVAAARALLPRELTAVAVAETGPALVALADYLQAVGGAMPAFPGWELPTITPPTDPPRSAIAAGLILTPRLAVATVALPPAAVKLVRASVGE